MCPCQKLIYYNDDNQCGHLSWWYGCKRRVGTKTNTGRSGAGRKECALNGIVLPLLCSPFHSWPTRVPVLQVNIDQSDFWLQAGKSLFKVCLKSCLYVIIWSSDPHTGTVAPRQISDTLEIPNYCKHVWECICRT